MGEETLASGLIYGRLKLWVLRHLKREADKALVEAWLEEFRKDNLDLTLNDAINRLKNPKDEKDIPAVDINLALDMYSIWEEEGRWEELKKAAETIRIMLESRRATPEDLEKLGLPRYRRKEVIIRRPRKWEREREELLKKIAEYEKKPPPPPVKLTSNQLELLYREFETKMTKALRRGLFPREIERFDELTPKIEGLTYEEAKRHVEMLADTIIAEFKPKIPPEAVERSFPLGLLRIRRRRVIAPPIPAWCRVLEHKSHMSDARSRAIELKRASPERNYGYGYDPEKYAWAVFECERVPATVESEPETGILYLPAIVKEWFV